MKTNIKDLEQELLQAKYDYYNLGNSKLSDQEFDNKELELRELYPESLYFKLKGDGFVPVSNWEKSSHEYHVAGQQKVKTHEEITDWFNKNKDSLYICQDKLDGISIVLTYQNGELKKAITRGDESGDGEDIFKNVRIMKGVPYNIGTKDKVVVRGEIVIKHEDFKNLLNEGLEYKNPRNTTTGIAKRYDGKYSNYLSVISYTLVNSDELNISCETSALSFLAENDFDVVRSYYASSLEDIIYFYNDSLKRRDSLGYDVDGAVIKTNIIKPVNSDYDYIPSNVAWKYPSQSATSTILNVYHQVSGSTITPVVDFEPVNINGVTINRATLHNYPMALASKIGIGSKVEITRRNDVIPKVETVYTEGQPIISIPNTCPECGGNVAYEKNSKGEELTYLICLNQDCPAKVVKQIMAWLTASNTKGIAEKTVQTLFENNIIKSLESFLSIDLDLYDDEILALDGFETKKLKTLKKEISKTKNVDLLTFLTALNFRGYGKTLFEKIFTHMKKNGYDISLRSVIQFIESNSFYDVKGFDTITIESLRTNLNDKKSLMENLLTFVTVSVPLMDGEDKLNGKSFCVTGALSIERDEFIEIVKKFGGVWKSGVSKNLDYLVTNDASSGSSKIKNAKSLGINVIDENQFYEMIGGYNPKSEENENKNTNKIQKTNRLVDLLLI